VAVPAPAQAGETSSRLERQIEVVERGIDDMLIDSPNFLVRGRGATQGIEDEDFGLLFLFQASLTGPWYDSGHRGLLSGFWPAGGRGLVVLEGDDQDRDSDRRRDRDAREEDLDGARERDGEKDAGRGDKDAGRDDDDRDGDRSDRDRDRDRGQTIITRDGRIVIRDGDIRIYDGRGKELALEDGDWEKLDERELAERREEKYARAKDEVVEVLLDYGEVLKALPAGRTVRIVARLDDVELPGGRTVRKFAVSGKIDDLRAYADGRLSEQEMRARLQIRES